MKEHLEDQIEDLKKQMEAMDAQIKSDRAFIDAQISEREIEREDYENKIKELRQLLAKAPKTLAESEDTIISRVSNDPNNNN